MLLSFQEKQELEKVAKWPSTKGQLVQGGYSQIGARGQAKPSDGVATLFSILFTVPSAKYTYKANGREYAGTKTLWPCLTVVTGQLFKKEIVAKEAALKGEPDSVPGNAMSRIQSQSITAASTISGLQALAGPPPPVTVRYSPMNAEISSLDPSILKPADSLFWTGAFFLSLSVFGLGLFSFNAAVTATPQDPRSKEKAKWQRL